MKMTGSVISIPMKINLILREKKFLTAKVPMPFQADRPSFSRMHGDDFCDNSLEALERIAEYEASVGVTAIRPGYHDSSCRGTFRCFKNCRPV